MTRLVPVGRPRFGSNKRSGQGSRPHRKTDDAAMPPGGAINGGHRRSSSPARTVRKPFGGRCSTRLTTGRRSPGNTRSGHVATAGGVLVEAPPAPRDRWRPTRVPGHRRRHHERRDRHADGPRPSRAPSRVHPRLPPCHAAQRALPAHPHGPVHRRPPSPDPPPRRRPPPAVSDVRGPRPTAHRATSRRRRLAPRPDRRSRAARRPIPPPQPRHPSRRRRGGDCGRRLRCPRRSVHGTARCRTPAPASTAAVRAPTAVASTRAPAPTTSPPTLPPAPTAISPPPGVPTRSAARTNRRDHRSRMPDRSRRAHRHRRPCRRRFLGRDDQCPTDPGATRR